MEKKSNGGLIGCLLFIIIILIAFIVLLLTGVINLNTNDKVKNSQVDNIKAVENNNIQSSIKSVKDVVGRYKTEYKNIEINGSEAELDILLTLYENGIFSYIYSFGPPSGTLGNYVVNNNKVILTYWYNTNSGSGLNITKGEKELIINEDGSITDSNIKNGMLKEILEENNISIIELEKTDDNVDKFDISNTLGAAYFTENNHSFADPVI